jgi:hypothetical protein
MPRCLGKPLLVRRVEESSINLVQCWWYYTYLSPWVLDAPDDTNLIGLKIEPT